MNQFSPAFRKQKHRKVLVMQWKLHLDSLFWVSRYRTSVGDLGCKQENPNLDNVINHEFTGEMPGRSQNVKQEWRTRPPNREIHGKWRDDGSRSHEQFALRLSLNAGASGVFNICFLHSRTDNLIGRGGILLRGRVLWLAASSGLSEERGGNPPKGFFLFFLFQGKIGRMDCGFLKNNNRETDNRCKDTSWTFVCRVVFGASCYLHSCTVGLQRSGLGPEILHSCIIPVMSLSCRPPFE